MQLSIIWKFELKSKYYLKNIIKIINVGYVTIIIPVNNNPHF